MVPRILVDTTEIPGSGDKLRLFRRDLKNGPEFSIMLGSNELMNSRLSGSEEALANLACEPLSHRNNSRILIGGLGMGFTLRAAQSVLPDDAEIIVAELVPAVIQWAQKDMAAIFQNCLTDSRVKIVETDVADLFSAEDSVFDAILLDVDNGPDGLSNAHNDQLYTSAGLRKSRASLKSGGLLAVWSSAPDDGFTRRLSKSGYTVEEKRVRAHNNRGSHHMIWLARR